MQLNNNKSTIVIGSDHGGFAAKESIKSWLSELQYPVTDVGAYDMDPEDDYPHFAFSVAEQVAQQVAQGSQSFGLLFCRSGGGMSIAANKVAGIRAVPVLSVKEARHAREHNDAQIISLAADWVTESDLKDIIQAFLETPASSEPRHVRRREQITSYEQGTKHA